MQNQDKAARGHNGSPRRIAAASGHAKVRIEGIVPVMITPFDESGSIDFTSVRRLTDWYLAHGADALFAVCQSSEMQFLSLDERVALARAVIDHVDGRVPVIVSGHVGETPEEQLEELQAMAGTGANALVLVSNRLDPHQGGTEAFKNNLDRLLDRLPSELPLGLYECPAPYRRLLSDDELLWVNDTNRFVVLKDVCCDLTTIKRRLNLIGNGPMAIINANAAIAADAIRSGSRGFCGVFANFHPDLYAWMYRNQNTHKDLAAELSVFLALSATAESMGYPALAKAYHRRLGTVDTIKCRVMKDGAFEKIWAVDAILDKIVEGTEFYRKKIAGA